MPTLAAVTYLMFLTYVANFLMLSAVAAQGAGCSIRLLGAREPRMAGGAFGLAFASAVLWPPLRLWTGGIPADPLAAMLPGVPAALSGHLLVAVGAAIALVSQYHMGVAWRIGAAASDQRGLVQIRPVPEPRVLGQALLFVGLFLAFPDLVQCLISAAMIAALSVQVRIEERVLATAHGEPYADYVARVPRWIGRPR